jgi:soluble lytic murein transglycosylase-like protein
MKKMVLFTSILLLSSLSVPTLKVRAENQSNYEKPIAGISLLLDKVSSENILEILENEKEPCSFEIPIAGISTILSAYDEELEKRMYDIPLSSELQQYTYDLSKEWGVDLELVFAIMDEESDYHPNAIGHNSNGTKDYGIMQINSSNHASLMDKLGITDFLDPKQNILAGIDMLSECYYPNDIHRTLMCYNNGPGKTRKKRAAGIYSTQYSREVVEIKENIKKKKN